ncbi:MAG: insulinase family protein, partial [Planctomycetes bacterium]|nr:insulinase family protein [Planctomycetota bacterium]
MNRRVFFLCAALLASPATAPAQNVDVKVHTLENGLKVLMVPRRGDPNITAGWIAKVGSVNERPGITGIAHLFEHMMFKGTRTIGTSDIDKDLQTLARLDAIKGEMQKEEEALARRLRVGEISDTRDPKVRSANHQELRKKFETLLKTQKANIVKDEFDKIYKGNGASGMNAGTSYDFTIYFVNVPANKLELWFWMESDRLLNPVFREFYSERDVVREERRLRVESTPTGKFEEQFDALFWGSSPYSWPVIGWPSDVEGITREEARSFYGVYYAPNNLTACLVGDFEPEQARKLAEKYFGRLKRGPKPPPAVRTIEIKQLAEKKMTGYAETKPQVRLRYHSVADGHVDEPALVVLQDILNGRTGRFYKSLVLDRKIATSAGGGQEGRKYEGYFEVSATAAEGHTPKEVQGALETILEELKEKDVGSRELQKVKNQRAASEFR